MGRTFYKEVVDYRPSFATFAAGIDENFDIQLESNVACHNFHLEFDLHYPLLPAAVEFPVGQFLMSLVRHLRLKAKDESCYRYDADCFEKALMLGAIAQKKHPHFSWMDIHTAVFEAEQTIHCSVDFSALAGLSKAQQSYALNFVTRGFAAEIDESYIMDNIVFSVTELRVPAIASEHWFRFFEKLELEKPVTVNLGEAEVTKDVGIFIQQSDTKKVPTLFDIYSMQCLPGIEHYFDKFGYGVTAVCPAYLCRAGMGNLHMYESTAISQDGAVCVSGAAFGTLPAPIIDIEIFSRTLIFPMDNYGAPEMYLTLSTGSQVIPLPQKPTGAKALLSACVHTLVPIPTSVIPIEEPKALQREKEFQQADIVVINEQNNESTVATREDVAPVEESSAASVTESSDLPTKPIMSDIFVSGMPLDTLIKKLEELKTWLNTKSASMTANQKENVLKLVKKYEIEIGKRGKPT